MSLQRGKDYDVADSRILCNADKAGASVRVVKARGRMIRVLGHHDTDWIKIATQYFDQQQKPLHENLIA